MRELYTHHLEHQSKNYNMLLTSHLKQCFRNEMASLNSLNFRRLLLMFRVIFAFHLNENARGGYMKGAAGKISI